MKEASSKRPPIKEQPLNQPGQSLDFEIELIQLTRARNLSIFCIFAVVAGYEVLHAYFRLPLQPIFASILALASGIYLFYADSQLRKKAKNYMQGSLGEKTVGDILDSLKMPGVRIFHDLVIDDNKRNIDHVILSRRGIFVVETKAPSKPKTGPPIIHSDGTAVFISGKRTDDADINQAVNNAKELQTHFRGKAQSVEQTQSQFLVKPILVYPKWYVKPYTDSKIWALNPIFVKDHINREPVTISKTDYALAESWLSDMARD